MRKLALAALVLVSFSACKTFKRSSTSSAHKEPKTTSIYGDWVLASSIDSTAFVGASQVEMSLEATVFRIVAHYPTGSSSVITGTISRTEEGLVTFVPQTGGGQTVAGRSWAFVPGQPLSYIASAAGGSLLFKPPHETDPLPSSVWNRREQAEAAGRIPRDSVKP